MNDGPGQVSVSPRTDCHTESTVWGSHQGIGQSCKSADGKHRVVLYDKAGTRRSRFKFPATRATEQDGRVGLPVAQSSRL